LTQSAQTNDLFERGDVMVRFQLEALPTFGKPAA
jgi:hypothetical protein